MTAQEIKALPKEFNFKSNINTLVSMYHAVETKDDYIVTANDGCGPWHYSKSEMHSCLLKGDFVIVEEAKRMQLYKVQFKLWNTFFSDLYDAEMLSVGNDEEEAINRVKAVVAKDARDFSAKEITEVFGYTITAENKEETK